MILDESVIPNSKQKLLNMPIDTPVLHDWLS